MPRSVNNTVLEILKDWDHHNPRALSLLRQIQLGGDNNVNEVTVALFLSYSLDYQTEKSDQLKEELHELLKVGA